MDLDQQQFILAEHILCHDRSTEKFCKRRKLKGQCRQEDIPQTMPPQDCPLPLASCTGEEDIFRVQHIDQLLTGM